MSKLKKKELDETVEGISVVYGGLHVIFVVVCVALRRDNLSTCKLQL
jgi:hypothetical protein